MSTQTDCEEALPHNDGAKARRIDLGLAVLSAVAPRRATHSAAEIAEWCECTPSMISSIEARALRRLREKVRVQFNLSPAEMANLRRYLALQCPS